MSVKHPVIAVTGSSGAGTTTVKNAFEHIFFREQINPLVIEGDSYHRYDRASMKDAIEEFATSIKLDPGFYQAHYDLGVAYRMQGRSEEAMLAFQTTLRLHPDHQDAKKELEGIRGMLK